MKIFPLGSSSKGNSTYIESEEGAILIDAGFGVRKTEELLSKFGFSLNKILAIFITHEHHDHVAGLLSLTKKLKCVPVYGSKKTLNKLSDLGRVSSFSKLFEIDLDVSVKVADFKVSAFRVDHDSACCLAFCVYCKNRKFSICTDLGCISSSVLKNLRDSNFVLLESNFDVKMLRQGKYPYILKKRIESRYGHLSNYDAAKLVCWLIGNGVRKFLIGHLSEKNNLPDLALKTIELALKKFNFENCNDYFLEVVPVKTIGRIYEV